MKYKSLLIYSVFALGVADCLRYLHKVGEVNVPFSTYIFSFLMYSSILLLLFFTIKRNKFKNAPGLAPALFLIWFLYFMANDLRAMIYAESYWDWKFVILVVLPFNLAFLAHNIGQDLEYAKVVFFAFMKIFFLFGFVLIPVSFELDPELYARIMIPVSFYLVFISYLNKKWKFLIGLVAVTSCVMVPEFRTNLIKIFFSILLILFLYKIKLPGRKAAKVAHALLFIMPLLFLGLGASGNLNIFHAISEFDEIKTEFNGNQVSFTNDTRTFLYVDVLSSLDGYEWIVGKGPAAKYHSDWFYNTGGAKEGYRYRSEVNILNILLYYGVLGVLIYSSLIFIISYYAVWRSNNYLSVVLGLVVASRWSLSFIEEYLQYDLNFFFFWFFMGMLSSSYFRAMSDYDLKRYFGGARAGKNRLTAGPNRSVLRKIADPKTSNA